MSEAKDGGKSGGWFPDFNYLLVALLAGTLFVTQESFHESRPHNSPAALRSVVREVNARTWQDPFEAVDKYVEKENKNDHTDKLKNIRENIKNKTLAAGNSDTDKLEKINVVVVMLPSGIYFEDGEMRRKLRYAVLSGFNTALHYMPESSSHLQYFQSKKSAVSVSYRVIYEWMIYPPTYHDRPPEADERRYERPPVLLLWLNNDDFTIAPHQKLKGLINDNLGKENIGSVAVLGPFDSRGLQDLVDELTIVENDKKADDQYTYYSPSATIEESNLLNKSSQADLHSFFSEHGLSFLRVTATDHDLANAIKDELKLRGLEPSNRNRILLVGEWDSLYTWHLTNTFAGVLLNNRDNNDCKTQDWQNTQFDIGEQCIFRASYLRGLDGEKPGSDSGSARSSSKNRNTADANGEASIEEASGDSQFDYTRRLAEQVERLDGMIRQNDNWDYPDPRAIKAIGILGSDVYDKLLITEALHSKFPDAVFFTNGMDARFIEPKNNEWARNMVIASGFGLTLDRKLQADIPPFRDNTQTAFFLATEMALAKQFDNDALYTKNDLAFGENIQSLLRITEQTEFDKLLKPSPKDWARLFEISRTQSYDLNSITDCKSGKVCLHPSSPNNQNWNIVYLIALIVVVCGTLLAFQPTREFFGRMPGLWFICFMAILCVALLVSIRYHFFSSHDGSFDGCLMFKLIVIAGLYTCLMCYVVCSNERSSDDEAESSSARDKVKIFWGVNTALIAVSLGIIWVFVRPQGFLDDGEPYALWDGISMWPSQAIRLIAFILASYYIIEVAHFPKKFTEWLKKHFCLIDPVMQTSQQLPTGEFSCFRSLHQWRNWKNSQRKRNCVLGILGLFLIETWILWVYGFPSVPFRGGEMFSLNIVLLQGLLLPASLILIVLVSDAVIAVIKLVENCFSEDDFDNNAAQWPPDTLLKFADRFNVQDDQNDVHELVGMRFIVELTKQIYGFIGHPLIIALLIVLACSSYIDNWIMPLYMKLSIGFSLIWLLYWDQQLKKAADNARESALKSLRFRAIRYQGDERTKTRSEQLERFIGMIENYDATVYKPFTQRPVFLNSLLIMLALLADSVDYYVVASKLFYG